MPFANLQAFHDYIRSALNESTSVDNFIVEEVRNAARTVEQDHNWRHMHGVENFQLSPSAPFYDMGLGIKRPEFLWTELEGERTFYQIVEVGELQVKAQDPEFPFFWWEARIIRPNWDVTEATDFFLSRWRYTTWPLPGASLPTVIEIAEKAVFHKTMENLGPILKDLELIQIHAPLYQGALSAAIAAESELMIGGRSEWMG